MAVAVAFSMAWLADSVEYGAGVDRARGLLSGFRQDLYWYLGKRRDALFELADAVLCKQDRVHMLAELSLEPECRRGHGAVYDALNCGQVRIARLRRALAGLPLPAWDDGPIRLGLDVSNWLRPDAETCPERLFCHTYARGKGNAQMIPRWPYSLVVAVEPGRTSWTLPLDAVRLEPADDTTAVAGAQQALALAREIGSAWDEAYALPGLGRCAAADDTSRAQALLRQAHEILQRIGAAEAPAVLAEFNVRTSPEPGE
jgi:DDE superfamily endonuclease